jgi:thiamine pyrophosphokinase
MRALVLADGGRPDRAALDAAWPGWDEDLELVIAADGGARHAAALGRRIDRWVGDGDSLGDAGLAALQADGVPIDRAPADKDESDTELAVLVAVAAGADDVTIVGALGGARIDHALANVALLGGPALAGRRARLLDGSARVSLLVSRSAGAEGEPATAVLEGRPGDLVTLLALGEDARGVTTTGLRFPLADEDLAAGRTRGLSNVRTGRRATVSVRLGRLLIVEVPATLST